MNEVEKEMIGKEEVVKYQYESAQIESYEKLGVIGHMLKKLRDARKKNTKYCSFDDMLGTARDHIEEIKKLTKKTCKKEAWEDFQHRLDTFIVTGA